MDKGQLTGSDAFRTMKTGHRAFRFERNTRLTKNGTKSQNLVEHASRYCASARLILPGASWRRVSPRPPPSWPLPPSFSCTVRTYTVHAPPPPSPHRPQFPRERSPPRAALPIPAPTSSTRRDAFGTSARSHPPANCKTPPMAGQWCMGKFRPSLPGCERPTVFIDSSTVCTQLRCDHVCFLSLLWAVAWRHS